MHVLAARSSRLCFTMTLLSTVLIACRGRCTRITWLMSWCSSARPLRFSITLTLCPTCSVQIAATTPFRILLPQTVCTRPIQSVPPPLTRPSPCKPFDTVPLKSPHTHTRIHAHTHTRTRTHGPAHAHTHTHTLSLNGGGTIAFHRLASAWHWAE